jgi:phage gpG-like protein
MADKVEAKVYGFDELADGGRKLAGLIEDAATSAFKGTAEKVAASTRARVPRRSGTLAASVAVAADSGTVQVGIGEGVPYAGWVEFGGTRGRPYFDQGRYLYPTALPVEPALELAARAAAEKEIGGMRWPSPSQAT